MNWQPIETAPKDGTEILAAIQSLDDRYEMTTIYWSGTCWQLVQAGGYATDGDVSGNPTHWMPLPSPPECK